MTSVYQCSGTVNQA